MLFKLHSIQALSLSVPREARVDLLPCPAVDTLLASSTIDAKYRQALENKQALYVIKKRTIMFIDCVPFCVILGAIVLTKSRQP